MTDQPNLSMAVDAGRIGCKNRLIGLIARPGGYGAWLAPQAKHRPVKRPLPLPTLTIDKNITLANFDIES